MQLKCLGHYLLCQVGKPLCHQEGGLININCLGEKALARTQLWGYWSLEKIPVQGPSVDMSISTKNYLAYCFINWQQGQYLLLPLEKKLIFILKFTCY